MTKTELRRFLKNLSRDQLEEMLLIMHQRQDRSSKEVFELVLKAVAENRIPPAKQAKIPDIAGIRKTLEKIRDRSFSWYYYGHRRARSAARKSLRHIFSELLLCPPDSTVFADACSLLEDCFSLCCTIQSSRLMNQDTVRTILGKDPEDIFRTAAGFILQSGYTRQNLKRLCFLSSIPESHDWVLSLHLQEIFLALLKNGDLRIELLELLEDRIQAADGNSHSGILTERLCFLYLQVCAQETTENDGIRWLQQHLDPNTALETADRYRRIRAFTEGEKNDPAGPSDRI